MSDFYTENWIIVNSKVDLSSELNAQLLKARREIKWKGLSQKDIDEFERIHNSSWYKNQMKNHVNTSNFVGASKSIANNVQASGNRSY